MRKIALFALFALVLPLALAVTGVAEGVLAEYVEMALPNGDICHVFGEVTVVVPASWAGRYVVLPREDCALFCQEASCRLWKDEKGFEDGGLLFAVNVSRDTGYRDLPDFQELGDGAWGHYFLSFPTDFQAYDGDEAAMAEYRELWDGIDFVRQNACVHAVKTEASEASPDFDAEDAGFEGTWVTFEDGFKLYLPSDWKYYEITDEQAEAGLFYRAGNDGGDAVVGDTAMGVAVSYVDAGDLETIDDLMADFEAVGFEALRPVELNGIPAVAFEKAEESYRGVAFFHPVYPGYVLAVYVTPLAEAGTPVGDVGEAILSSLSPWSEAAAAQAQ